MPTSDGFGDCGVTRHRYRMLIGSPSPESRLAWTGREGVYDMHLYDLMNYFINSLPRANARVRRGALILRPRYDQNTIN